MNGNKNTLEQIQNALAKDEKLKNYIDNIYVLVNNGDVILAGSVDQISMKNLAKNVVSHVPGVNLVIDDLKVESPTHSRINVQIDWANSKLAVSL